MKTLCFFLVSVVVLAFSSLSPAEAADLSVKQGGREILSFTKTADGFGYRAASARLFLDVVKDKGGYKLVLGGKVYKVKEKEKKYKIYDQSGTLKFAIKEKENKIKILKSENDPAPWAVKFKGDHYKVTKGEQEIGKIKFYQDKKKIKVKDAKGTEICEAAANKLHAAPAVLLFTGLNESDMLILFSALALYNQ